MKAFFEGKLLKIIAPLALIGSFGLGYAIRCHLNTTQESARDAEITEIREHGFSLINPLLECEQAEGRLNRNMTSFRDEVIEVVEKFRKEDPTLKIGVYFRDLNNGPWFGINEKEGFLPASLLKLPLLLNFYKIAETRPQILSEKLTLEKRYPFPGLFQVYNPAEEIEEGKEYTIEELLQRAIIFSDNQAAELMYEKAVPHVQSKGLLDNAPASVQSDLRYIEGIIGSNKDNLSAKDYSTFFRILFNASYLDRILSERALTHLSNVQFRHGLRPGVPEDIKIAHKFGEAGSDEKGHELHDCGIIYYPNSPYLLCVMTKGKETGRLPTYIQEISKKVYEKVKEQDEATP